MKQRMTLLIASAVLSLGLSSDLQAQVSFSAGIEISSPTDFYRPLESYGGWVDVPSYGRCWRPSRVDRAWRPYTTGYWQWTDVGWYWVSDEPWAWATYHYGSWIYDPNYGWVWIPGTEWAPAWVSWRESDDYVGWAPCGPGGVAISPSWFVFIDVHRFHSRFRPSSLIYDNRRIISRTRRVGDFRRERHYIGGAERRVVFNPGPSVQTVQRATGQRFNPVPVQQVIRETPVPSTVRRRSDEYDRSRSNDRQRGTQAPRFTPETRSTREPAPAVSQPTQRPLAPDVNETRRSPEPTGREQPRIYRGSPAQPEQTPSRPAPPFRQNLAPEQPSAQVQPPAPVAPPQQVTPAQPAPKRGNVERPSPPAQVERPTPPVQVERSAPPAQVERRTPPAQVERPVQPPAPVERPVAPAPERPTNPTGRERGNERSQEKAAPPAQRPHEPREARPQGPPPGQDKERDKEKDKGHP
jgi:hypothetical protein